MAERVDPARDMQPYEPAVVRVTKRGRMLLRAGSEARRTPRLLRGLDTVRIRDADADQFACALVSPAI